MIYNSSTGADGVFAGPVTLAASSTLGVGTNRHLKLTGVISGAAGIDLTIRGSGTAAYIPVGQNTYQGDTHLVGAMTIANSDSVGSASTGNLVSGPYGVGKLYFDGGKMRATTGTVGNLIGNELVFTADTTFPAGTPAQTLTFTGPVTLANSTRTLTHQGTADIVFTGVIGGAPASA